VWARLSTPRTFRLARYASSWQQLLWAAVLWGGDCSAISHRAAAALYRLDGCEPGPVELTVDVGASCRAGGLRVHQSKWEGVETRTVSGLRVTAPEHTLVDLARTMPLDFLDDVLESALRLGLTTPERVRSRLGSRPGSAALREILEHRGYGRPRGSRLEGRFLRVLRDTGLPLPTSQHEVRIGAARYFIDFAYPELRLAIELDGLAKRTSRQAVDRELARQNAMVLDGWTVLRFTWSDVTERPDRVVDCVLRAVAA
jgi:very-short-patch-repair endonuclease